MMSEQLVFWEHEKNAVEETPDLSILESWKKQGKVGDFDKCNFLFSPAKLFPFVFLCCIFRSLSFALITSMLRYWSIPLYIVLILGSISLGGYKNREDQNFVTRGVKSVLSVGDIS